MAIDFACVCGKTFSVPESQAGKRARCGACKTLMDVPTFVAVPAKQSRRRGSLLMLVLPIAATVTIGVVMVSRPKSIPGIAKAVGIADDLEPDQRAAVDYQRKYANDPSSVEIVEIWKAVPAQNIAVAIDYDTAVFMVVRAKNEFGALMTRRQLSCLKGGAVVYVEPDPDQWEIARLYGAPPPRDKLAEGWVELMNQPPLPPARKVKP